MGDKNWLCINWEDIKKKKTLSIWPYVDWEDIFKKKKKKTLFTWATGLEFMLLCCEDAKKEIMMKRQKVNQVIGSEKVRRVSECNKSKNICVIYYSNYLFSLVFLSNWEGKIMWAQRDYFPHHFLFLLFSLSNQIRKNFIFHHIFLSFFSILSIKLALFLNMPSLLHQ